MSGYSVFGRTITVTFIFYIFDLFNLYIQDSNHEKFLSEWMYMNVAMPYAFLTS